MTVNSMEIARRLGVSQPTVSLVLNGRGEQHRICKATRDRVLRAATDMNYQPNRLARGLASRKTNTIGLVIRTLDHPVQSALNERLIHLIEARKFEALITVVPELLDSREVEELYYSHYPEGMIVGPLYATEPNAFLRQLTKQGFPLVGFEGDFPLPFDQVTQDRRVVLTKAFTHLTEQGHRRIGYIEAQPDERHEQLIAEIAGERLGGISIYLGNFENGLHFANNLTSGPGAPTAYVFQDNCFAAGFLRGASKRGIRVPDDVAFVVCAYCQMGDYLTTSLTTVYADMNELAEQIVSLMLARIQGKAPAQPQHIVVKSRLVVRESSVGKAADTGGRTGHS